MGRSKWTTVKTDEIRRLLAFQGNPNQKRDLRQLSFPSLDSLRDRLSLGSELHCKLSAIQVLQLKSLGMRIIHTLYHRVQLSSIVQFKYYTITINELRHICSMKNLIG